MKTFFITCAFLITGMMGTSVHAAATYDELEIAKLRNFLMQESAVAGVKNYQQLGLTSMDSIDWWSVYGLTWNRNTYYLEYITWVNINISGHLDLSDFAGLEYVYCPFNDLKSVDLSNSSALLRADFFENDIDEIDVSTNPRLEYLRMGYNNLRSIDVSKNPNLGFLCCTKNQVQALDLSNMSKLNEVTCLGNRLYTLSLENCPELEKFMCDQNFLTTLNLYNLPKLKSFSCMFNLLTDINFYNCGSLTDFSCYENSLSYLDFSHCENLKTLNCGKNQLTAINLEGCQRLTSLNCDYNSLSSLDISQMPLLTSLSCKYNKFTFMTLPFPSAQFTDYAYTPQNEVEFSFDYNNIDLSDFYNVNGTASTFIWRNTATLVTPLESNEGWFAFDASFIGETFICWVQNKTFPYLTMHFDVTLTQGDVGNVNPEKERPSVYASEHMLHLVTDLPVKVNVYSLQGALLMKRSVDAGHTGIPVARGMYVVVVDDRKLYKVIVR